jgi:hypothetical protein
VRTPLTAQESAPGAAPAPPDGPAIPARHLGRWLVGGLAVAIVAAAFLPWECSFIDDGALLTALHSEQAAHGWLGGVLHDVADMYLADRSWGLFRPAFWVYSATFYALPVGVAHAVRLAMVACALAGPLALVGRRFTGGIRIGMLLWTGAVLCAGGQLFAGI